MAEVTAEITVDINLYSIEDSVGNGIDWSSYKIDSDNDIFIKIEGVVITEEQKDLLDRAEELTKDDWDLIATQNLINP